MPDECTQTCNNLHSETKHRTRQQQWHHDYYLKRKAVFRERSKAWAQEHPERMSELQRQWAKKHPERLKAIKQRYRANRTEAQRDRERQKQREQYRQSPERKRNQARKWRHKNASKVKQQQKRLYHANAEKHRDMSKRWAQAHPEYIRANNAKYRAQKRQAPINDFTAKQWCEMKAAYDYRCVYCHKKTIALTQDHIVPLSKGGSHTLTNIVPACLPCNVSKNAGPPPCPVQPLMLL